MIVKSLSSGATPCSTPTRMSGALANTSCEPPKATQSFPCCSSLCQWRALPSCVGYYRQYIMARVLRGIACQPLLGQSVKRTTGLHIRFPLASGSFRLGFVGVTGRNCGERKDTASDKGSWLEPNMDTEHYISYNTCIHTMVYTRCTVMDYATQGQQHDA